MEFLISNNLESECQVIQVVKFHDDQSEADPGKLSISLIEAKSKMSYYSIVGKDQEFLIFGDLIFDGQQGNKDSEKLAFLEKSLKCKSIYKLKGFFYLIVIDRINSKVEVHTGLFNILPIYYFRDKSSILISSSIRNILNCRKKGFTYSEKYAVEKLLFNYSFENRTLFNEINLIPSCSYIEMDMVSVQIKKTYNPYDLYVSNPLPWRNSADKLSDLFLDKFKNYLPEEPATISLTGGLDGRTLLSSAIKFGYIPETFSYGSPSDSDILIPEKIAEFMKFRHTPFFLTRDYAKESFWKDGLEFLDKTEFSGNISRAHYVYTARALSKKYKYLLSGNFGSELFRSMKSPGVLVSPALFALFRLNKKEDFEKYIITTPSFKYLNVDLLERNLPGIVNDAWDYKMQLPAALSYNQKFYSYIFSEIFRKYFGPEIIFQMDYIVNRSPFLDFHFIEELLKTKNAGAYYNFNETNPFSRFHGQVLYSHIIKKSCGELLLPLLDKGYSPGDFFTVSGRIQIMLGYLKRKMSRGKASEDPLYSKYYYEENFRKIKASLVDSPFLNIDFLKDELENNSIPDLMSFANVISLDLAYDQKI